MHRCPIVPREAVHRSEAARTPASCRQHAWVLSQPLSLAYHHAMNIVIMGCGRVGSTLAARLDRDDHHVTVIDTDPYSFRRLPSDFRGDKVVGSGFEDHTLVQAGIRG